MAFMDMIDNLAEKCGLNPGDRMQYGLVALTIVTIIVACLTLIVTIMDDGRPNVADGPRPEFKFYCLKTKKEFIPQRPKVEPGTKGGMDEDLDFESKYMIDPYMQRAPSPFTGKKTAVPMMLCPACKRYYVPEAYVKKNPELPIVCTFEDCQTNLGEYWKKKRAERRR